MIRATVALAGLALSTTLHAANIYMLSSGDFLTDDAAVAALTARGHTVTLGVQYPDFDGTINLSAFQTLYLQANANWTSAAVMPLPGQQQLIDWVNAGGRLVTSEWVIYYTSPAARFGTIASIIPGEQTFSYGSFLSTTYTEVTPGAAINAGLTPSFSFNLYSYTGTETLAVAKAGATVYYSTANSPTAFGLAGWPIGQGQVFSFSSTCGPDQVADANFGILFSNVMGAGGGTPPCYANCDNSTTAPALNVADFTCFLQKFAAGDPTANCDNSTTLPTLNVADFTCFLQQFAAGCP